MMFSYCRKCCSRNDSWLLSATDLVNLAKLQRPVGDLHQRLRNIHIYILAVLFQVYSNCCSGGTGSGFSKHETGAVCVFENIPLILANALVHWILVLEVECGVARCLILEDGKL